MERNLVIYLDTCIYGRPFDRPQTPEIRAEVAAIDAIFKGGERGELWIMGSAAVYLEIGQITNAAKRKTVFVHYSKFINEEITPPAQNYTRARALAAATGLGEMDAVHLVIAEEAGAGFLLTVDRDFIKKCNLLNLTTIKVYES
jgi:predicted nucleic acid-binding protein